MEKAVVINGKYTGRIGNATKPNKYGNVMFYPAEGIHPYRVCLTMGDIQFIKGGDAK